MDTTKTISKLAKRGLKSNAHHATIKKEWRAITGSLPTKEEVEAFRALVDETPETKAKTPKPAGDLKELMARAKDEAAARSGSKEYPGWHNVQKVIEAGKDGMPKRVIIQCADPQVLRDGSSVCIEKREIAAQDVFQVHRCEPCQKRANVLARNEAGKERRRKAAAAVAKRKSA